MRVESPEEVIDSARRPASIAVSESAAAAGMWSLKLAGYALATVAFTFMLLRPRRVGGSRGSLFLGSGLVVVLMKTLFSASDGASPTPAPAPAAPMHAAATPAPAPNKPPAAATKPPRKRQVSSATVAAPNPVPVAGSAEAAKPQPAKPAVATATKASSALGPRYADKASGFSVQFPTGWSSTAFKDGAWVLDASDGQAAAITVGFSKFPAKMSVNDVVPEKVARTYQKRPGTVVQASGYGTLAGRRCLWHKYTGPITRPDGGSARMAAVHYLLPLQDGRALEVRVAATPEKFRDLAPRMKQSLDSLKLLSPVGESASAQAR